MHLRVANTLTEQTGNRARAIASEGQELTFVFVPKSGVDFCRAAFLEHEYGLLVVRECQFSGVRCGPDNEVCAEPIDGHQSVQVHATDSRRALQQLVPQDLRASNSSVRAEGPSVVNGGGALEQGL